MGIFLLLIKFLGWKRPQILLRISHSKSEKHEEQNINSDLEIETYNMSVCW